MRIRIKVVPRASREEIVEKDGVIKVYVRKAPEKGRANKAVIELVARRFCVRKSDVTIVSGATSRDKLLHIRTSGR